jgi:hypothetical protein
MSAIDRLVGGVVASGALSKAEKAKQREVAKVARRKQHKAEREKLNLAAAAQIWDDREGKARPTPQRRRKGVFSLRDGDDAGVSVAVDEASSCIDALAVQRLITARQREAGHVFEEVSRGAIGSPAGRSCVDFTPVGHEGDEDDEDAVRAQARWRSLRRMLSPAHRQECMAVCWQGAQPVSMDRLRAALDVVGDWAGLEKERC